jgi:adenylosuccinate synthase
MHNFEKKVKVIVGLQWGDEGKGKFIDYLVQLLSKKTSLVVARFQGGSNAGHSIEFGDTHIVFHALPSGMLEKNTENFIGAGVNVDVISIQKEIALIESFTPWWKENLFIAREATVVVPTGKLIDKAQEESRGKDKIGTTLKAIGPTYADFYGRTDDLSVGEAYDESLFEKRYVEIKTSHLKLLSGKYGISVDEENLKAEEEKFFEGIRFLRTLSVVSSYIYLQSRLDGGKQIFAEGAQGTLLDVRFGTRRDVTSSHTTSAGACVGLGLPPQAIGSVLGICKAYTTRVGSGAFPTELGGIAAEEWAATHSRADEENLKYDINDSDLLHQGIALRTLGREYGATTGRLRRCGWLDLALLKYAITLNGVTELGMTKLDILDTLEKIVVCIGYEKPEEFDIQNLRMAIPVYKTFPGWKKSTRGITSFDELPSEAKEYLKFIEDETRVPITFISTGPARDEMIAVQ